LALAHHEPPLSFLTIQLLDALWLYE